MADIDDASSGDAKLTQPSATDDASPGQRNINEPMDGSEPFQFVHSHDFPGLLESLGATLVVSTYQAGKLVTFRAREGRLSMLLRTFDKAMGIAVSRECIAVGTTYQVWQLRNSPEIAAKLKPPGRFDACFIPRASHVTGNIDIHEIAWGIDAQARSASEAEPVKDSATPSVDRRAGVSLSELWVVNTLFSCLCTIEPDYSFVPRWRPPFVTEIRRHDRCHLNGLAMVSGRPKYVTAFGETDTPEGWRPGKVDGGVVIDVETGATIARGLSMPHSPRFHDGRLWVLDSGRGRLCVVDPASGKVDSVAELPGYTRGLVFVGPFALVGLSKIREKAVFGGVPIAQQQEERKCGVWVVDTRSGQIAAFLDFQQSVEELFDVQLLLGLRFPELVGFQKDTIQRACVIAPQRPVHGQVATSFADLGPAESLSDLSNEAADHNGQGLTLIRQKRFDEALAELRMAVKLKPDYVEAHNNLGSALLALSRSEDAAVAYRTAIRLNPEYVKAWSNLGHVLTQLEKYDEAEKACRRAIELDPDYAIGHNHLGNVLRAKEELDQALTSYRKAIDLKPDYVIAHCGLGSVLRDMGQAENSERSFREALRIQPDLFEAHLGLGNALFDQERLEEAVDAFQAALQSSPDDATTWKNLGLVLQQLGQFAEAERHFEHALKLAPDSELVHVDLAFLLFIQGEYERAWPHHDWRWKNKVPFQPPPAQQRWDGSPLQGRTIVLYTEQGLGDTIQFIRFARIIDQARVIVACQPNLVPLLKSCPDIDSVTPQDGSVPACDMHAPLMSVPAILGMNLSEIPSETPYLYARNDLKQSWCRELKNSPGIRVGIAWQGNPEYLADRRRSIPLAEFAPLAKIDGVTLISLQKGLGIEQIGSVDFQVIDFGDQLDRDTGAFEDTAALMTELDLVISSDTASVHLAGALGVPVWVALCKVPDWRFMMDREDSPWYPTMRLFRQTERGNWQPVFERMADALRELANQPDS